MDLNYSRLIFAFASPAGSGQGQADAWTSLVPLILLMVVFYFVLIRPQSTARNGDIVVAQVEENAVTLKRFFKEKDKIRLQPANPNYPPQFYDDVRIQGKLIGVIRRLD